MRNPSRRALERRPRPPRTRSTGILLPLCLALLILPGLARARSNHIIFSEISIEEGLSRSIVSCLVQDRRGFMWFGTEDGLNRYDGYRVRVLRHDPHEANSLSYNEILSILEDRSGMLWIGTFHGGLNRYDPVAERFTHYRHDPADPNSLGHDIVRVLCEDRGGRLWAAPTVA